MAFLHARREIKRLSDGQALFLAGIGGGEVGVESQYTFWCWHLQDQVYKVQRMAINLASVGRPRMAW